MFDKVIIPDGNICFQGSDLLLQCFTEGHNGVFWSKLRERQCVTGVTILTLLRGSQTNRFKLHCTISLMFTQSVSVALYSRDTRPFQRFPTVAKLQRETWMPNIQPEKPGLWNSPLELHDGQWQQDEARAWTGPWCREKRWRGEPDTEPGGCSHKSPALQLEPLDKHTNICKNKSDKIITTV